MNTYIFTPQETDYLNFTIEEVESFEEAADALGFELSLHEYAVEVQPGGVMAVNVFLKGNFIDTLLGSELEKESSNDSN